MITGAPRSFSLIHPPALSSRLGENAASVFQEVQNLFAEDLVIGFLHHHRVGSALDDLQARALVPKGVKSFLVELGRSESTRLNSVTRESRMPSSA